MAAVATRLDTQQTRHAGRLRALQTILAEGVLGIRESEGMMAKRKTEDNGSNGTVSEGTIAAMVEEMKSLAFTQPDLQYHLLRLARIGGLTEVEKEIRKLRGYAKRANG